jgi:hypothetical protein
VGLTSSRRVGLPEVGWVGMERAAGTVGTVGMPVLTETVRVPEVSVERSASAAAWAAARRAP